MTITTADKAACARREAKMRARVYPRWVANGKMTQAQAERETAIMNAIAQDYETRAEAERMTSDLFGRTG
jgi:hypothetical protein